MELPDGKRGSPPGAEPPGGTKKAAVPWWCSCRVSLALVSFFGTLVLAAARINLSVAIVCMVNHTVYDHTTNVSGTEDLPSECRHRSVVPSTQGSEFTWNKEAQGIYLGAFFWGYLSTQLPGGWMAERFGGKRVIGWSMLMVSMLNFLTPAGTRVSPWILVALRVMQGMGAGVVFPAMHCMWSYWAPALERAKLVGFSYAGAQVGNIVTLPIAGLLCEYGFDGGWPSIFYLTGCLGILWFILWMLVAYDNPQQHPRISDAERQFIIEATGVTHPPTKQIGGTPWRNIFSSLPMWAILLALLSADWGNNTLITNMPTYMREVLKFDIRLSGALSCAPFFAFWLCINLACYLADVMISRGWRTRIVRKIMQTIGSVLPGVLLVCVGYVTCDIPYVAITLLVVSVGLNGFYYAGCVVNHLDIAPPFSGTMLGITNSAATLSGILAPYTVGVITKNETQEQWRYVFYMVAAINVICTLFYAFAATGEVEEWVKPYMIEAPQMLVDNGSNTSLGCKACGIKIVNDKHENIIQYGVNYFCKNCANVNGSSHNSGGRKEVTKF